MIQLGTYNDWLVRRQPVGNPVLKARQRKNIARQIEAYLQNGGKICQFGIIRRPVQE